MSIALHLFISIFALVSVQAAKPDPEPEPRDVKLPGLGTLTGSVEYHTLPDERFANLAGYTFVALNIPFAKPPVHEQRFAPPEEFGTWNETIDGNRHQKGLRLRSCHQEFNLLSSMFNDTLFGSNSSSLPLDATEQSEDCLYLNVWVPLDKNRNFVAGLSVMVWIHGGGFTTGSAFTSLYEGLPLSITGHVIIVTVNYRLSSLGFLYNGEKDAVGNMGLMDQAMAIKWVRDNINNFGGDPESITIFGESAGSGSVNYQMLAPMSRPNFKRAIMQSGNAFNAWAFTDPKTAEEHGKHLGEAMGCNNSNALIVCLRGKNATDILNMGQMLGIMFGPTKDLASLTFVGQDFIPKHPEELLMDFLVDVKTAPEVMLGDNQNEGSLFLPLILPTDYPPGPYRENNPISESLFQKTIQMFNVFAKRSDYVMEKIEDHYMFKSKPEKNLQSIIKFMSQSMFTCNTTFLARKLGSLGKVAMYRFKGELSLVNKLYPWMGAAHALDIAFVFGNAFLNTEVYTDDERMTSSKFMKLWTHFAKHGIDDSFPTSHGERRFVLDEHFKMTNESGEIKIHAKMMDSFDDQCHFIDCLPSLELFGDKGELMDQTCTKYTVSGSEKTRISMVLSWFLAFRLLFFLH